MAINTKAIKARINSVKNTKKISKAMQMIATVKMRKAVQAAINTRAYASIASEILNQLGSSEITHYLARKRTINNILLVIITSNKGLCGNYNNFVLKEAQKVVNDNPDKKFSVLAIGNKSAGFAKKNGFELEGIYSDLTESSDIKEISVISKYVMDSFKSKKFDKVYIVSTNYISGLVQRAESKALLPLTRKAIENINSEIVSDELEDIRAKAEEIRNQSSKTVYEEYEFEPKKKMMLDFVLPMLVEVQIFQALLESFASEHSSRMIAMKSATDAASDMIDSLTLEFNKGRQAAITQEVAEINAGADALS